MSDKFDKIGDFIKSMIAESASRADHLNNQASNVWEQFRPEDADDDDEYYSSFSNAATDKFDWSELLKVYKKSYPKKNADAAEGGASAAIYATRVSALFNSAVSGLSQRRLSRVRSAAAQLSRRKAMAEHDLNAMQVLLYDGWNDE